MKGFVKPGVVNVLMDGQFGSTGKGVAAGYVAMHNVIHLAVTNAAPNAGHTVDYGMGRGPQITRHLPASMLFKDYTQAYLCAGAVIDVDLLVKECRELDVDPARVIIHPRAAVITDADKVAESAGSQNTVHLASTQKGVGESLSRKIRRTGPEAVAEGHRTNLEPLGFQVRAVDIEKHLRTGLNVMMEVPQGFDLSINSGLSYPYCTSREITVAQALADAQVHPSLLGNVLVTLRSFPIRVGNVFNDQGQMVGWSGPFHDDQKELEWDAVGVEPEETTVTKRKRRIATFSNEQFRRMMEANKPTHLFLNFCQYCRSVEELNDLIRTVAVVPISLGFGPCSSTDVVEPTYEDLFTVAAEQYNLARAK